MLIRSSQYCESAVLMIPILYIWYWGTEKVTERESTELKDTYLEIKNKIESYGLVRVVMAGRCSDWEQLEQFGKFRHKRQQRQQQQGLEGAQVQRDELRILSFPATARTWHWESRLQVDPEGSRRPQSLGQWHWGQN